MEKTAGKVGLCFCAQLSWLFTRFHARGLRFLNESFETCTFSTWGYGSSCTKGKYGPLEPKTCPVSASWLVRPPSNADSLNPLKVIFGLRPRPKRIGLIRRTSHLRRPRHTRPLALQETKEDRPESLSRKERHMLKQKRVLNELRLLSKLLQELFCCYVCWEKQNLKY